MLLKSFQPSSLYTSAGRRKYLTPDERRRFLGAAYASTRPELRTFCLVLAYTGCRISEALALRACDIASESGHISVRSLKKRREVAVIREVPVPANLLNALLETHDLSRESGEHIWPWSRSRAWQLVKAVMDVAEIPPGPHATPKGLRHGFGVHAIHSGVPLNLVQRWLGHSRLETTAIYLQAMGKEEREIASRMWS
jgi:integrase